MRYFSEKLCNNSTPLSSLHPQSPYINKNICQTQNQSILCLFVILKTLVSKIRSPEKHLRLSFLRRQLTILREKLCFTKVLINSVQGMTAWLLLIFFICLQNQLSSLHSIIMMFEKCDSSNRQ